MSYRKPTKKKTSSKPSQRTSLDDWARVDLSSIVTEDELVDGLVELLLAISPDFSNGESDDNQR